MKGCLVALGIFLGLVIGGAVYIWLSFYSIHVRYRLTVEVQDGDQVKSGSSVLDAAYIIQPEYAPGFPSGHTTVVGYAPTVDLGEKGMLFLTFSNATRTPDQMRARPRLVICLYDDMGCMPFAVYSKPGTIIGHAYSQKKVALSEVLRQNGPRDVPFVALPELIRFPDINDPNTYWRVSPYDLSANFGSGVQLKRVILELTHDPITPPPEIWPEWLKVKGKNTEFRGYENG